MSKGIILLVDDDKNLRRLCRRAPVHHGYSVIEAVERAVDTWQATKPLNSATDETAKKISMSIDQVRGHDRGVGGTTTEQLFLLGYVSGLVRQWSIDEERVKSRFHDYLRAVLVETGILSEKEIDDMLGSWQELNAAPVFSVTTAEAASLEVGEA